MNAWPKAQKLPFSKRVLPKRVIFSYILDYVIIIVLVAAIVILDKIPGFRQHFSLTNIYIQYPFTVHEHVSSFMLIILAGGVPACIITLYTLVIDGIFSHQSASEARVASGRRRLMGRYRFKDRLWELNCGILGLLLSLGLTFVVTGALKNAIGKPRPDFLSRCIPREGALDNPVFGLSNSTICTADQNSYLMKDGFRSFPSGHSSSSFSGLFYLSLYLAAKLHLFDSRGEVWKAFIVLTPTLGAALIAGSRIIDYRHHPFDVITGSMLGVLMAWASYRQYFPPLSEPWKKGRAHPIRTWGHQPEPPPQPLYVSGSQPGAEPLRERERSWKVGDEEQGLPAPSLVRGEGGAGDFPSNEDRGSNVFRQQISTSQRHRQSSHPAGSRVPTAAPVRVKSSRYHPSGRHDGYWSSSSEEERHNQHDGFELQSQYTLSEPSRPHELLSDVEPGFRPEQIKSVGRSVLTPVVQVEDASGHQEVKIPRKAVDVPPDAVK